MPKKKDQNVEAKKVVQEEGTILVTRTTVVSGKEIEEESSQETTKIKVRPFLCQPAYVSIKMGETIPLIQTYASRRIDVNVSHPCYKEELPKVLSRVVEIAKDFLSEEIAKMSDAAIPRILKNKAAKKTRAKKAKKEEKPVEEEKDDLDGLLFDDDKKESASVEDPEIDDEDDDLADII